MAKTIRYQNSEIGYIQSKENQIITIISIKHSGKRDTNGCLRNLELLAKRVNIKEIWIPLSMPTELKEILERIGYKESILGKHEESNQLISGFKKIL